MKLLKFLQGGRHEAKGSSPQPLSADGPTHDVLKRYADRIAALETRLESAETALNELRLQLSADQHVDVVRVGDVYLFMYSDDYLYTLVPHDCRNLDTRDVLRTVAARDGLEPSHGLVELIMDHYAAHGLSGVYLDVGCNYGVSLMRAAAHARRNQYRFRCVGFDPGRVRTVVAWNLRMNALADVAEFEPIGISCCTGPQLLHYQLDHTEDEHLINRGNPGVTLRRVIETSTLDDWVQKQGDVGDAILKIDTQGAEWDVFDGMQRIWTERQVTGIFEFTPRELDRRGDPVAFLRALAEDAWVFDLGQFDMARHAPTSQQQACKPLSEDGLQPFVDHLRRSRPDWTDVLTIPKRLPAAESLLGKLAEPTTKLAV